YISVVESLKHAGFDYDTDINIHWINSEDLDKDTIYDELKHVDGIVVPGGFGSSGMEGKIEAIRYARENKVPFLGICLGLQLAAVEFARNVLGYEDANTTEADVNTTHPIIKELTTEADGTDEFSQANKLRLGA